MPITFPRPICHGLNHLHMALPPPHCRTPHSPRLSIGTLNIRYDKGFGLAQSIQAVERGGFDIMLLMDTKIQTEE